MTDRGQLTGAGTSSEHSPELQRQIGLLAAAVRAGLLPTPGAAPVPLADSLEADQAELSAALADHPVCGGTAGGPLERLPGTVRGPLQIAAAAGPTADLVHALGRAFGIQRSDRADRRVVLGSTMVVCGLAAVGTLVLTFWNAPLLERQMQFQAADANLRRAFLADAFGPWPVAVSLVGLVLLCVASWAAIVVSGHRRLNRSLARWVASEAHAAMSSTGLSADNRAAIIRHLLAGWCPTAESEGLAGWEQCPATDGGTTRPPQGEACGLLGMALATPPPRQAAALARAVLFHRRHVEQLGLLRPRLPRVFGSLAAGLAVLLYGIALMRPLAGLFEALSTTPAATLWEAAR